MHFIIFRNMRQQVCMICCCFLGLYSCQFAEPVIPADTTSVGNTSTADTVALRSLIRNLYEWVEQKAPRGDFLPKDTTGAAYRHIDWEAHARKVEAMKESNLFTAHFTENYSGIAAMIDSALRSGKIEWPVGEIAPFSNDADPWCDCQDSPPQYWDSLRIGFLSLQGNEATLQWNWQWPGKEAYRMKASRNDGVWRIQYLQGFDIHDIILK